MTIDEFLERLQNENKMAPGTHQLEPGLSDHEFDEWRRRNPKVSLPEDYVSLLRRCNGLRMYPDSDTPTGDIRLLPLKEVGYAARHLYLSNTSVDDDIPKTWFALTDDPDSARFLVLDASMGNYLEVDPGIPTDAEVVGSNLGEVLEWLSQFFREE